MTARRLRCQDCGQTGYHRYNCPRNEWEEKDRAYRSQEEFVDDDYVKRTEGNPTYRRKTVPLKHGGRKSFDCALTREDFDHARDH